MPQGIITKNLKKHSVRTQEIEKELNTPPSKRRGKAQTLSRTDIKQNTAAV